MSSMMTIRRFSLIAFPIAALATAGATRAADERPWDGAWTGSLRNISPISVTIEGDKVVSYAVKGAPIPIAYDKVAPNSVSFGDRDNYHGRMGYATTTLTKQ